MAVARLPSSSSRRNWRINRSWWWWSLSQTSNTFSLCLGSSSSSCTRCLAWVGNFCGVCLPLLLLFFFICIYSSSSFCLALCFCLYASFASLCCSHFLKLQLVCLRILLPGPVLIGCHILNEKTPWILQTWTVVLCSCFMMTFLSKPAVIILKYCAAIAPTISLLQLDLK